MTVLVFDDENDDLSQLSDIFCVQSRLLLEDISSSSRNLKDLVALFDSRSRRCIFEYVHLSPFKVLKSLMPWAVVLIVIVDQLVQKLMQ